MVEAGKEGRYDRVQGVWQVNGRSMAGDMTAERFGAQLVTVNGRVFILGGGETGDGNILDTVEELNMEQRTWRRLGVRMKTPRRIFAATVMGKRELC